MKVLVLGIYDNGNENDLQCVHTSLFSQLNSKVEGKLVEHVNLLGPLKLKNTRVISKVLPDYPVIVVVGLGSINADFNEIEQLYEKEDNIRRAIANAVSTVRSLEIQDLREIHFDDCGSPENVAIGAIVSDWRFDELKSESLKRKPVEYVLADQSKPKDFKAWETGCIIANLQNTCRRLQELPSNILTPTRFSQEAQKLCEPLGVKVIVHDREWAEKMKMGSFLSVTNGSDEPCKFVELHYFNAGEKKPLVFIGKGITFDTGGISLKPSASMDLQRGDMSGGATVLTSIATLAKLKSKVNVIGLIPLTENAISGKATKPGDVVYAMNGKSIQVDNTDAEGRLILADAICYADTFNPEIVVDIATLTGACRIGLGDIVPAVFSTKNKYWEMISQSGSETGDRVWRMPLFSDYAKLIKNPALADLINTTKEPGSGAGTVTAAMFLKEFTRCKSWMHVDMANVKYTKSEHILGKGMTGIPLRTMVKFIQRVFK